MSASRAYLVVGVSTGLGEATVNALRRGGHRVVTAGRTAGDVRVDLRSLKDVKRAGDELAALGPFDGIVCNAGLNTTREVELTVDGIETTFAVNVLSHVALVERLATPTTRVAMIGSGTLDPDNKGARRFGFRGGLYTTATAIARGEVSEGSVAQRANDRYATSKLCDLLYAGALARRGIPAFTFDPGAMPGTGLARNFSLLERIAWNSILRLAAYVMPGTSNARRSAKMLARFLTAPEIKPGAYYEYTGRELPLPAVATRIDQADDLVDTCRGLIAGSVNL